ncbi:MAG TPA: LLM class flavin-dependent oxidoreductase [Acidimicrobiales bacterium]|nr:LLM class flavin-dependent oxidoreductase [Acidimicrobiales bacterium]
MTRVGVIAPHAVAIRDLASFAVGLADLGYSDFWAGESDRADGIAPLAIAAASEPRLSFGTAIVPVYTRGRALLAQTAATLASAAPGRVTIGLGASSPAIVEGWNSIPFVDPLARVRDSVRYLRRALSGEKVDGGFRLGLVPDPVPALAIGALQPQMLRLAGGEGDGVVLTSLGADDVAPLLERVAPARSDFAVIAWVTVCVVTDRADDERALAVARRRVGRYLLTPTYARYHRWLGRGDLLDRMGANPDDAPEQLIRDLVVIGSPDQCRAQLERYVEAGVTTLLYEVMPLPHSDGGRSGPGVADLAATLSVLPTNFRSDGRSIPT